MADTAREGKHAVEAERVDPRLIELCREMTPEQRLEAAVKLSELVCEFGRAGERNRRRRRIASLGGVDL